MVSALWSSRGSGFSRSPNIAMIRASISSPLAGWPVAWAKYRQRNLEAGLLLQDPALARDLTAHFDALAHAGALLQIHGSDPHR